MAISLALTVSTAELEQLQQTPGVLVALARESLLTEVTLDPALVETSEQELKRLQNLLSRMEVRDDSLKIQNQEDPGGK